MGGAKEGERKGKRGGGRRGEREGNEGGWKGEKLQSTLTKQQNTATNAHAHTHCTGSGV